MRSRSVRLLVCEGDFEKSNASISYASIGIRAHHLFAVGDSANATLANGTMSLFARNRPLYISTDLRLEVLPGRFREMETSTIAAVNSPRPKRYPLCVRVWGGWVGGVAVITFSFADRGCGNPNSTRRRIAGGGQIGRVFPDPCFLRRLSGNRHPFLPGMREHSGGEEHRRSRRASNIRDR